jgi:hypothetical protein
MEQYINDISEKESAPDFNGMVALIEKNFKNYLQSTKAFTDKEIEDGWQRYKALNHLYQNEPATQPPSAPAIETLMEEVRINMATDNNYAPAHNYAESIEKTLPGGHYQSALIGYIAARDKCAEELELRQLCDWKESAMSLFKQIDEYVDNHPEKKLGGSKVDFVIERAKKYDQTTSTTQGKVPTKTINDILLSDIDAPIFTHTKEFENHFNYIKSKFIEILSGKELK